MLTHEVRLVMLVQAFITPFISSSGYTEREHFQLFRTVYHATSIRVRNPYLSHTVNKLL